MDNEALSAGSKLESMGDPARLPPDGARGDVRGLRERMREGMLAADRFDTRAALRHDRIPETA